MTDLIDTTEMYLRTVYELNEEGIPPLRARIAERLGHSGPTVSQTVARMERDGLIAVLDDRSLELTATGRKRAVEVMRRHRLAERLLIDVIGLDWEHVHDEACRWEHVMSSMVERRLITLLNHPVESPYGTPIPGLSDLGEDSAGFSFLDGVTSLEDYLDDPAPKSAVVRRIGESAQEIETLTQLANAGILPGARVSVEGSEDSVYVSAQGRVEIPLEIARHIFVSVEK